MFFLTMFDTREQEDIFIQIYKDNKKIMFSMASKILYNNGWAEDAVHDTFLRIAKNILTFSRLSCNERRYLCVTIVKNISLNILRDSHKNMFTSYEDENIPLEEVDISDDIIVAEQINELIKLIETLPDILADVIKLRLVMELSSIETAKLLEITEETVRVRLHRGRMKLIELLKKERKNNG